MKYKCPACKKGLEIDKTADQKALIRCPACGIGAAMPPAENDDLTYLEFLDAYDKGRVGDASSAAEGQARSEAEIAEMTRGKSPAAATARLLASRRDYVVWYDEMRSPEPEMGPPVAEAVRCGAIAAELESRGVSRLYRFQDRAVKEITAGRSVVIEAPTASGKTEAFAVPVVQNACLAGRRGAVHALFVYPTKALARDQLAKVEAIAGAAGLRCAVYDGDTARLERERILARPPDILLTNFDMLHYHLWHGTRLAALLPSVRVLVADEVHVYTGIFGSNVHYVAKRLARICPGLQFVCASATLRDAGRFCSALFSRDMVHIPGDGPQKSVDFVITFPTLSTQRATMVEAARSLVSGRHKTLVFSNSHHGAELLAMSAQKRGVGIMVHRSGLTAAYRGSVEKSFRDGRLGAVSCTPTLELGMDIGDVDGVVSAIVPVNRLMQRIGRAARRGQKGQACLVLGNDPISQYYREHPADYFEDGQVPYIDPANPFVEEHQVLAMSFDRPIRKGEMPEHEGAIGSLLGQGLLRESGGAYSPDPGAAQRLESYSIRGMGEEISIYLDGKRIGDRVMPMALGELHKDAVYFLAGRRYRVDRLEYPSGRRAVISRLPRDYPYYTRPVSSLWPSIEETIESRRAHGTEVRFCRLRIKKTVSGYSLVGIGSDHGQEGAAPQALDRPVSYSFVTKGLVFQAPRPERAFGAMGDDEGGEGGAYHAAEHVMIEWSNAITGGAAQDMGGVSMGNTGLIFIYDGAIGGSGASRALYERFEKAVGRSRRTLESCPCSSPHGCPRCTYSYHCGNGNRPLHKAAALEIFERIEAGEQTVIPDGTWEEGGVA